jgi:Zc3h12a-like Ribonuclease NYN domain/S1 RNA binding domain
MPKHVVVDGSNIATEGRTMPSLRQLNDAVLAYIQEHPDDLVTVVVDATFGHRIDPSEVPEFDAAVENNELVSPPAGAIGRGDAFVLTIANKAAATILSNDSFQEFHGDYPWLFDEGRLIGGKPVPHVGWVFVPRAPVRGPVSRRAVREKKAPGRVASRPSKLASGPMPVPKTPPPSAGRRRKAPEPAAAVEATTAATVTAAKRAQPPAGGRHGAINELLPFLGFVERHPIGSTVDATIDSYSSHGAYVDVDGVRAYVPLRFLGAPPPRSAREVLALGSTAAFVVVSFNAPRRGIDLAMPGFQPADIVVEPVKKAAKRTRKAAKTPAVEAVPVPAPEAPAKKATRAAKAKKAAEPVVAAQPVAEPAPPKRTRKKAAAVEAVAAAPEPVPAKRSRKKASAKTAAAPAPTVDGAAVAGLEPAPAKKARAPRAKKAVSEAAAS